MDSKIWAFCCVLALISCSMVLGSSTSNKSTEASPTTTTRAKTPSFKTDLKTPTHHSTATKAAITKPASTKGNATKTTMKPKVACETRNKSCSFCTDDNSCFYCSSDKTCHKYHKSKIVPRHCTGNKWYWKQCKIAGNILIIVIPTVTGVFLIMLGCCIYCCCCRRCGKSTARAEERRQRENREDRKERNDERKNSRKARQEAIRMKYGLLQNQDEDDDMDPIV